jgi:hypothetical protein
LYKLFFYFKSEKRNQELIALFLFFWGVTGFSAFSLAFVNLSQSCSYDRFYSKVREDTWVSFAEGEQNGNNGDGRKLKVKGSIEYSLLNFDLNFLRGKRIRLVLLKVRTVFPEKVSLGRVGCSTIASTWGEGTSKRYIPQKGGASFLQSRHQLHDWAYHGSTLLDAVFGRGQTEWRFSNATVPNSDGWQTIAIDPDIISACVAGISHGICLWDEVGHIWSCENKKFNYQWFPNRFFYSSESWKSHPYLEVWVEGEDHKPPDPINAIQVETETLPAGEALVSWITPPDHGGTKTLGFHVSYSRQGIETEVPRYLIPMAGQPGGKVRMHLQDLPFKPGEQIQLTIKPVDAAGNVGPPFSKEIQLSQGQKPVKLPPAKAEFWPPSKEGLTIGNLRIGIIDLLDKTREPPNAIIPSHPKGYQNGNHLFSAKTKTIKIQAARNEAVCFQILLQGASDNISVDYRFHDAPQLKTQLQQPIPVPISDSKTKKRHLIPDPLLPIDSHLIHQKTSPSSRNTPTTSILCETYIPHNTPPGKQTGSLTLTANGETIKLKVELTIWDFTLPDKLSFIPEMNAYGTVSPYKGYAYYRLAHAHRTCLNRLPYGWNGKPEFSPEWDGKTFDWKTWDQNVSPLLDGAAFSDLPRAGEPVDVFYLPFNENWPVDLYAHYTPSYWADEAFTPEYENELENAFAAFGQHATDQNWTDTIFQFYLNNKIYFRKQYPQSSAPWIFDEPVNTQDFWALRWYGIRWQRAVNPFKDRVHLWFRGDISYYEFARNMLWGVMDVTYIGGNNPQKMRMHRDEQILFGKSYFAEYGSANPIEAPNLQPVLWCLSAWSKGAMGVLPWQTIGSKDCWKKGEQTALFYPHPTGPKPSLRLKAFRHGQQMVEYLTLLQTELGIERWVMADWLKKQLNLTGSVEKRSEQDAGTIIFKDATIAELWRLRYRIGSFLSQKSPPYKRALVQWESPKWEPERLPDIGYVSDAPGVESQKPDCESFRP